MFPSESTSAHRSAEQGRRAVADGSPATELATRLPMTTSQNLYGPTVHWLVWATGRARPIATVRSGTRYREMSDVVD